MSAATVSLLPLQVIEAELCRRSLRTFVQAAWHVVEPATPFTPGWHLDAIAEHLTAVTDGQIRNLVINMPPRHSKSLQVAVFWPVWEWLTNPARRWLFASYALSLSIRDSLKCRRLIESPWFQQHFADRFQLTSDQNVKARFENDQSGYRLATSVGGAATGEGGDRIIVDDPHNLEEADSETIRDGTLTWWDEVMSTRLNDPKTGAKVIVMQRCHERDLSGHVLAKGGYEHLMLPAEYDGRKTVTGIGWTDPRTTPGELLWPARFGRPELETLKTALGSYGTAGQLQQAPTPRGGAMIKRGWFNFYKQLPTGPLSWLQSWDFTFKDLDGNDFVCGGVFAWAGADVYLVYRIKERLDFPGSISAIRSLSAKYPQATLKLVEDKANGPAIIAMLKREIAGLVPVEPQGSKIARLAAASPVIESGNLHLPDPSIAPFDVEDYIAEMIAFPKGAHDDQVDMTSQALARIKAGAQVVIW